MDVAFIEDIARDYSQKRKGRVTEEEAKDLLRIIFKYLSNKLSSDEHYNYNLGAFGQFYKYHDLEQILSSGKATTKEKKLMERELVNKLYGLNLKPEYTHNETEFIINNTNNHPIKN